jgi:hypothetical protein
MFKSAVETLSSENMQHGVLIGLCHGMVSAVFGLFVLSCGRSEHLNATGCSTYSFKSRSGKYLYF